MIDKRDAIIHIRRVTDLGVAYYKAAIGSEPEERLEDLRKALTEETERFLVILKENGEEDG